MDFTFGLTFPWFGGKLITFSWTFILHILRLIKFQQIAMIPFFAIAIWELCGNLNNKSVIGNIVISTIILVVLVVQLIAELMVGEVNIFTIVQTATMFFNLVWHISIIRERKKTILRKEM